MHNIVWPIHVVVAGNAPVAEKVGRGSVDSIQLAIEGKCVSGGRDTKQQSFCLEEIVPLYFSSVKKC